MAFALPMTLHLDLKGAPPTLDYLAELLPFLGAKGISGLLVEYEDVLPFASPPLCDVVRRFDGGEWTRQDVGRLVDLAEAAGMTDGVTPLVQTLGHVEYLLKHPSLVEARELPDLPECLCAGDSHEEDSVSGRLLRALVDDVLDLHPTAHAIHIGGDEAWHLGKGERSQASGLTPAKLFLRHMRRVCHLVWQRRPNVQVLMWDDMLRGIPQADLESESEWLRKVQPVIWQYTETLTFPPDMWTKYHSVFPSVVVASAFKGASSSCARIPPISRHVANHLAWRKLIQEGKKEIPEVKGLFMTGWQRFDHFALLCELLPVSIPSLCCCIRAFTSGEFSDLELLELSTELGFESVLSVDGSPSQVDVVKTESFPGADLFVLMQTAAAFLIKCDSCVRSSYVKTWCSDWHFQRKSFSVMHARKIADVCYELEREGCSISSRMIRSLRRYYKDCDAKEWLESHFNATFREVSGLLEDIKSNEEIAMRNVQ